MVLTLQRLSLKLLNKRPREGMREFMGKNASHTLIVILVYRTHFVHVLDGTILLQILVVVDQSSVHDQNGSYP